MNENIVGESNYAGMLITLVLAIKNKRKGQRKWKMKQLFAYFLGI